MRFSTVAVSTLLGLASASPLSSGLTERADTFANPIIYEDYPDLEVIRVGDAFYYTSSTFAFSPGAPVLKSYDLVHWTPVSHSVPTLNFASKYNLNGASDRAYVKGIWASTLKYRNSTDAFHWLGCVEGKSYLWTSANSGAKNNNGEVSSWNWQNTATFNKCYYDCGMLIDDDDTIYVAYGSTNIMVAQLNQGGTAEVKSQQVYSNNGAYIEGSRMYKINGYYYILVTKPSTEEWVLKSKSPWGPYEMKYLVQGIQGPLSSAGAAHQGGLVSTKDNKWYYIAFLDSFPAGRIPVAAPITWSSDGWPTVTKDGNSWGKNYPMPVSTTKTVPAITGTDSFTGTTLSAEWEWNHNPDTSKFKLLGSSGGLQLSTATVTTDLYNARNTLTHRIIGPKSAGIFRLDISKMADGDRAGAALFRDNMAYIGVHKSGSTNQLVYMNNISLDSSWNTKSTGSVAASTNLASGVTEIWLKIQADVTPAFGTSTQRQATFWYSTDGNNFSQLGGSFGMINDWQFFTGYRYAAFNFATKALGGQVTVKSFSMNNI